ncbi:hypothetical protein H4R34_001296 [Dimargaris verticillata]|uniref:EamA domain-containing protein n=1 Tax=Dimargaris verticillata TaxID=2761393 RepID=A0A9W8B6H7_9FUNG|nr:hypothetical protein H4R34_001296 [Dimargaris verticillata]
MSFMFQESDYNKPMFITYLNTASFTLYLFGTLGRTLWQRHRKPPPPSPPGVLAARNSTAALETGHRGAVSPLANAVNGEPLEPASAKSSLDTPRPSTDVKRSLLVAADGALNKADAKQVTDIAGGGHPADVDTESVAEPPVEKLSLKETGKLSLMFCLLWFAANATFNASLAHTSVSNGTILGSTSGLFTLLLGVIFRVEQLTVLRVVAVAASIGGVYLVTTGSEAADGSMPENHIVGDILAIISAFFYGCYTILIKFKIGSEDRVHMPDFLGFVGLFNTVLLWPLLLIFHYTGIETFALPPTGEMWGMIALNALIGTLLSDYLWLLAVLMTSPLVVTLGMALTNPLTMLGDIVFKGMMTTPPYWIGVALVLAGFLISNK